jgi:hypothetical protein
MLGRHGHGQLPEEEEEGPNRKPTRHSPRLASVRMPRWDQLNAVTAVSDNRGHGRLQGQAYEMAAGRAQMLADRDAQGR